MNITYLFITRDEVHDGALTIGGEKFHHLAHVRRLRVGAALRAALPDGRVLAAEVTEVTATHVHARVTGEEPPVGVSPCRITLCQAVLKGEKMDLVVQKACELGVHALLPVLAKRSIPRWTPPQAADRADRWQRIAEAAAEQCERSVPMQVLTPVALSAVEIAGVGLLLHEREGRSLRDVAKAYPHLPDVQLFIGPEGGWGDAEVAALRAGGVIPIHLGRRILRAETASLAAVTLAQYEWGDLGHSFEGE